MKNNRLTLLALLAVGFSWTTVFFVNVQPSYSETTSPQAPVNSESQSEKEIGEQELQQFAQAYKQVREIQQNSEIKMVQAVEGEGLSPERFIEISESQKNPKADSEAVSTEEQQSFENAKAKIIEIKQTSESDMALAIEAEGLNIPRFNEILTALQQDSQLREQVQQMIVN
jgi:hypothetical protein